MKKIPNKKWASSVIIVIASRRRVAIILMCYGAGGGIRTLNEMPISPILLTSTQPLSLFSSLRASLAEGETDEQTNDQLPTLRPITAKRILA
jgi:hypothetical protein